MRIHRNKIPSSKCEICEKIFLTRKKLTNHMKNHNNELRRERKNECPVCKMFVQNLKEHVRIHTAEKPYKCQTCEKSYFSNHSLKRHMSETKDHDCERPFKSRKNKGYANGEKHYKCQTCEKSYVNKVSLSRHIEIHLAQDKIYKCQSCEKSFYTNTQLKLHARNHKPTATYVCNYCEKMFYNHTNLIMHVRIHTGEKPYICNLCKKSFVQAGQMNDHIKRYHKEKFNLSEKTFHRSDNLKKQKHHKCQTCDKSYVNKVSLSRHMEIHLAQDKIYKCQSCEKSFYTNTQLKLHARLHDAIHVCVYCKKMFSLKYHLKMHLRIHTGEKPYKCQSCDAAFEQSSSLKYHVKRHHKNENHLKCNDTCLDTRDYFLCEICGTSRSSENNFRMHLRVHSGEKPYMCQTCGKSFSHYSAFKSHLSIHTDEKDFKCKSCDKTFRRSDHLRLHMRRHTKEKPFKCKSCEKSFGRHEGLKRHVLSAHVGIKHYKCNMCDVGFTRSSHLKIHMKIHDSGGLHDDEHELLNKNGIEFEKSYFRAYLEDEKSRNEERNLKESLETTKTKKEDDSEAEVDRETELLNHQINLRRIKAFSLKVDRTRTDVGEISEGNQPVGNITWSEYDGFEEKIVQSSWNELIVMTSQNPVKHLNTDAIDKESGNEIKQSDFGGIRFDLKRFLEVNETRHKEDKSDKKEIETRDRDGFKFEADLDFEEESETENGDIDKVFSVESSFSIKCNDDVKRSTSSFEREEERFSKELTGKSDDIDVSKTTIGYISETPTKSRNLSGNVEEADKRQSRLDCIKERMRINKKCKASESTRRISCTRSITMMSSKQTDITNLENAFSCSFCDESFSDVGHLHKHVKSHVNEHQFKSYMQPQHMCHLCGNTFTSTDGLKRHLKIHSGERPHKCLSCGCSFKLLGDKNMHMKIHSGETPYMCHSCGRRFLWRRDLNKHVTPCSKGTLRNNGKSNNGLAPSFLRSVKNHRCKICEITFASSKKLYDHTRIHKARKIFTCNICKQSCQRLTEHMRIHTGEKPFKCQTCEKAYPTGQALKRHTLRRHMMNTQEKPYN